MRDQVLIIVHQETSTPGRVGVKLEERGYRLDIRRPCLGHVLPDSLEHHAGAVVFGGPMSANDTTSLDFIKRETEWLDVPLREEVPFLGICLGAQMLACHLGARVAAHPDGRAEIGYYPLRPTAQGKRLAAWPDHAYQWHREGFDIPRGGTLLATGDDFPNQAFSYGSAAFGIQFHPEVTLAMMHRWTVRASHRFSLPGAQNRAEHLSWRLVYDGAVARWLDDFLDLWLASGRQTRRLSA